MGPSQVGKGPATVVEIGQGTGLIALVPHTAGTPSECPSESSQRSMAAFCSQLQSVEPVAAKGLR